ncbi:hypothetical protein ML462_00195 [Gramella lutea]|uniref:Methyltransferase type 11 domain-containing protein n=1 Tax=Christiangramia lutea TaxID=1607951 RepID=A0A9X2AA11_9FLAO|nr:hypothetical protein [Christiangramia lutea]MCH4821578.1 hypothetical protein [Christiangramia lutea]
MSLKLRFKNLFFQLLGFLPERSGNEIYHFVQEFLSKESLEFKVRSSHNSFRTFLEITQKKGISIENRHVAEIGSGWLPLMPYFFSFLSNAKSIETFDLHCHYQKKNIEQLNEVFSKEFEVKLNPDKNSKYALPSSIRYFPNSNILDHDLTDRNLIFSRFVLEHVRPEVIEAMHLKFKNELKAGSFIIHMISPGDHRAYVDKELSLQDFLKYSEHEWKKKHTRFDYHNRLRLPQYLNIFNKLNLEIIHVGYEVPDINSEYYRKFKNLNLHHDFKAYKDEELMAGAINIILKV